MKNLQNPILSFRNIVKTKINRTKDNYNMKLGGRIDSFNKFLVESKKFN